MLASTRNTPSAPSPTVVGLPGAEALVLWLTSYVRREAHHEGTPLFWADRLLGEVLGLAPLFGLSKHRLPSGGKVLC